eukprot:2558194-Pleurochrysis_carterae.AAC.3
MKSTFLTSTGVGFESTLRSVEEATASGADMTSLKARLSTPHAAANHAAVVDWARRWLRMKETIALCDPDIIALQEVDRMAEIKADLEAAGYSCSHAGKTYIPAHRAGITHGDLSQYLAHLHEGGVAFAPTFPSKCRELAVRTNPEADDMGCALFWRERTLAVESISFFPLATSGSKSLSAAVRVTLRARTNGRLLHVICTHLKSGDNEEAARMRQLTGVESAEVRLAPAAEQGASPTFLEWVRESAQEAATILSLDANSVPNRPEGEAATVWRSLRGLPGASSVWDGFFCADGSRASDEAPLVATTNKMRGPLSRQPEKIGQHAFGVIDHVFFWPPFSSATHAIDPIRFPTLADARRYLLPSLAMPSDHMPVLVDLSLA